MTDRKVDSDETAEQGPADPQDGAAQELEPQEDEAAAAEQQPSDEEASGQPAELLDQAATEATDQADENEETEVGDEAADHDVESPAEPGVEVELDEGQSADSPADDAQFGRDDEDVDSDTETLEAPVGLGEPEVTTERVVEAVLFASDAPLPLSKIVSIVGVGSARDVRNHIKALNEKYERVGASFRIEQIASGYQMLTLPVYNTWIRRLKQNKQDSRLSQAALETLAVVAYKQPVVRADIEAIRGVSAGEMLNRLREVGLIKIVGRAEDVGRPMLYGTTRKFLEVFGLSGLDDLPSVEEMQPGQSP